MGRVAFKKKLERKLKSIKRVVRFFFQRLTRGWDDSDLWSLDYSLAKLITPRLRLFAEHRGGHPACMTEEEWATILNKMCEAFEYYGSDERWGGKEFEMCEKHQEGLDLFAKHYGSLWT